MLQVCEKQEIRNLCTALRAARKRRSATQESVAGAARISPKYLSAIENAAEPSLRVLFRILRALNHDLLLVPKGRGSLEAQIGAEITRILVDVPPEHILAFLKGGTRSISAPPGGFASRPSRSVAGNWRAKA